MHKQPKTEFVKPVNNGEKPPHLNLARLIQNNTQRIETSLMLDTNMLIRIEKAVKKGNKPRDLKAQGLQNLVKILNNKSTLIAVSAGIAITEMPPARRPFAQYCYDEFLRVHASHLIDDPRGIHTKPKESTITQWRYDKFDGDHKKALSFYYGTFLLLQLANRQALSGADKFKFFLDRVIKELDLISAPITEIAKLCFYDKSDFQDTEFEDLVKRTKENFLKTPKMANGDKLSPIERIKHSAFNATCDLLMLITATYSDAKGLENSAQDTWIVTSDNKLARFIRYFSYIPQGETTGLFSQIIRFDEQTADPYWQDIDQYHQNITSERIPYAMNKNVDVEAMAQAVERIHTELEDLL